MKFAKYWEKRDVTVDENTFGLDKVSIWGASNESASAAKQHADKRFASMSSFFDGDFSKKDEYEYWTGFVKEEVLDEVISVEGDLLAIVSRNSYGATILNTDNVVFGDIDIRPTSFFDRIMHKFGKTEKDKRYYLEQIEYYQERNPSLSFRVYETHSGIRFMLTNKQYSPADSFVESMFNELNVDPLYMRLCKRQESFRARLTPKPWRVGITRPLSRYPRSSEKEKNEFQQWLANYKSASTGYTTTRYLISFGIESVNADVQKIIDLHDAHSSTTFVDLA